MHFARRLFTSVLVFRRSSLFQARFSACHPRTSFRLQVEKSSGQDGISYFHRQKPIERIGAKIGYACPQSRLLAISPIRATVLMSLIWHLRISPARPLSSDPAPINKPTKRKKEMKNIFVGNL